MYNTEPETNFEAATIETENGLTYLLPDMFSLEMI
jgi:hypothetical protein